MSDITPHNQEDNQEDNQNQQQQETHKAQPIIINQNNNSNSNPIGIAGFITSILAYLLYCIPIVGHLIWILGLVLSIIGLFNRPRGLAIAGVVISLIWIIFYIMIFAGILFLGAASEGLDGMP